MLLNMNKQERIPHWKKNRPLSWSAISSFMWNPEQWHDRYIMCLEQTPSKEMIFGKYVGEKLASDPFYLPEVERYDTFEYKLECKFQGIPLVGYIDSSLLDLIRHKEYKTGKKLWDKKRADSHGQITMYSLMIYLIHKIKPEDIEWHLVWLPTQDKPNDQDDLATFLNSKPEIEFVDPFEHHVFTTKRTMKDILEFGNTIKKTYKLMEEYANNHD